MSQPYVSPDGASDDGNGSPVAYIGSVVFNAKIAGKFLVIAQKSDQIALLYQNADLKTDGAFDFRNPELALIHLNQKSLMNNQKSSRTPFVISCLSAILKNEGGMPPQAANGRYTLKQLERMRRKAMKNFALAGIVQGSVKVNTENPRAQEVSINCGGLMSIVNTGTQIIRAGDELYWDFPKIDQNGQADKTDYTTPPYYNDQNKIPVVVRRYKHEDAARMIPGEVEDETDDAKAMEAALTALLAKVNASSVKEALLSDEMQAFVRPVMRVQGKLRSRIFATAKQSAAPGKKVAVVFGNYSH